MYRKFVGWAIVAAVLGGAGCGGGQKVSDSAGFNQRIEAICKHTRTEFFALMRARQRKLHAAKPSEVGSYLPTAVTLAFRGELAALEDLTPPAEARVTFEQYKGAVQVQLRMLKVDAVTPATGIAHEALVHKEERQAHERVRLTRKLGVRGCT